MAKKKKSKTPYDPAKELKTALFIIIPMFLILILGVFLLVGNGEDDSAETTTGEQTETTSTLNTDSSLTVEDGDTVNIDYVGSIDGVEFDGGNTQGAGADLTIGSGTYIDDFEEQLIGAHPGDTVDVYATFPENYGDEGTERGELNGKEALFVVTVNGIYK